MEPEVHRAVAAHHRAIAAAVVERSDSEREHALAGVVPCSHHPRLQRDARGRKVELRRRVTRVVRSGVDGAERRVLGYRVKGLGFRV